MSTVASKWRLAHKTGQLQSMQRVTVILSAILFATILCATHGAKQALAPLYATSAHALACIDRLVNTPPTTINGQRSLSPNRVGGVLTSYRIISDISTPAIHRPNALLDVRPLAPTVNFAANKLQLVTSGYYEYEDPLPPRPKVPVYRTQLSGITHSDIKLLHPARLVMPDIKWPDGIQLSISDTPSVSGFITLHADGHVSFIMHEQSHPGLSFDTTVYQAIQKATCDPALNYRGARISIVAPYRVIFRHVNATINSTKSVLGSIYNDTR